jgi:hypothetical protein
LRKYVDVDVAPWGGPAITTHTQTRANSKQGFFSYKRRQTTLLFTVAGPTQQEVQEVLVERLELQEQREQRKERET